MHLLDLEITLLGYRITQIKLNTKTKRFLRDTSLGIHICNFVYLKIHTNQVQGKTVPRNEITSVAIEEEKMMSIVNAKLKQN